MGVGGWKGGDAERRGGRSLRRALLRRYGFTIAGSALREYRERFRMGVGGWKGGVAERRGGRSLRRALLRRSAWREYRERFRVGVGGWVERRWRGTPRRAFPTAGIATPVWFHNSGIRVARIS